jgi:hypothetical protein
MGRRAQLNTRDEGFLRCALQQIGFLERGACDGHRLVDYALTLLDRSLQLCCASLFLLELLYQRALTLLDGSDGLIDTCYFGVALR